MENYFNCLKELKPKQPVKGITVRSVYLDNVMLTYMEFEPGSIIPEHKHPQEQITLILKGGMEMTVGKTKKTVKEGDIISVPSNVIHSAQILD
jgi:quercetin dioxygenase-like cupin family protein